MKNGLATLALFEVQEPQVKQAMITKEATGVLAALKNAIGGAGTIGKDLATGGTVGASGALGAGIGAGAGALSDGPDGSALQGMLAGGGGAAGGSLAAILISSLLGKAGMGKATQHINKNLALSGLGGAGAGIAGGSAIADATAPEPEVDPTLVEKLKGLFG